MDRNVWSCRVWQARQAGDLTAQDVLTARALLRRVNGAGCCWPSEARIAADAACSTRTVRRTKARLRDLGLISWVAPRRRGSVLREVCRYRLTVPTIKKNLVVRPTDRMAGELIQSSFSCGETTEAPVDKPVVKGTGTILSPETHRLPPAPTHGECVAALAAVRARLEARMRA